MKTWMRACALMCVLALVEQLPAETAAKAPPTVAPDTTKALTDALKLRVDMAGAVTNGSEKPDAAIARLQASASPTGLKLEHDADFAMAAIDVGHRLVAMGKPTEAGQFFQKAESSLTAVLSRTLDTDVAGKVQYLANRAFIRAKFLNEPILAKKDLDAALLLKPDDCYLQSLRNELTKDKAAYLNSTTNG
jgi:hypothetical protein